MKKNHQPLIFFHINNGPQKNTVPSPAPWTSSEAFQAATLGSEAQWIGLEPLWVNSEVKLARFLGKIDGDILQNMAGDPHLFWDIPIYFGHSSKKHMGISQN